jgi:hypothetical protein
MEAVSERTSVTLLAIALQEETAHLSFVAAARVKSWNVAAPFADVSH